MRPENENPAGRAGRSVQRRDEASLAQSGAAASRDAAVRAAPLPLSSTPSGDPFAVVEHRLRRIFPGREIASAPCKAAYAMLLILEERAAEREGLIELERLRRCLHKSGHSYYAIDRAYWTMLEGHAIEAAWNRRRPRELYVDLAAERDAAQGRAA